MLPVMEWVREFFTSKIPELPVTLRTSAMEAVTLMRSFRVPALQEPTRGKRDMFLGNRDTCGHFLRSTA
jgi:hypothetical protein